MSAWYAVRIRADAESGKQGIRLQTYLDELVPEQERVDREAERLIAHFDSLAARARPTIQPLPTGSGAEKGAE